VLELVVRGREEPIKKSMHEMPLEAGGRPIRSVRPVASDGG